MPKTTSQAGIDLIKRFEGLRLSAYLDAVGVPTIGYGHTLGVQMGQKISEGQAENLLKEDLAKFESAVNRMVTVELNQHEFDALVSFSFNVGQDALRKSTLLRMLNDEQRQAAADQFWRWDKAGGRVLPGLKARRADERDLFLRPVRTGATLAEQFERAQPWDPDGIAIDLPTLRSPFPLSAATEVLRRLLPQILVDLDNSVRQFQAVSGLTADGVVGPVTWAALLRKGSS
jgi:GH24 family phage-related lysozyme (muramidase)